MSLVNPKSAEDLASALEKNSFDGQVLSVETVKSFEICSDLVYGGVEAGD